MYRLYKDIATEIAELNKLPRTEGGQISARAFNKAMGRPRGYLGTVLMLPCIFAAILFGAALSGWDESPRGIIIMSIVGTIGSVVVGGGVCMTLTGPLYLTYLRQELQARQDTAAPREHEETGNIVSVTDPPTLPPGNKPPMSWFASAAVMAFGGFSVSPLFLGNYWMLAGVLRPLAPPEPAWEFGMGGAGFAFGALLFLRATRGRRSPENSAGSPAAN
jgi:hypothetical protein